VLRLALRGSQAALLFERLTCFVCGQGKALAGSGATMERQT
jgi:hypothetical protein